MINDTNESKLSKDKIEESLVIRLLAKTFLLKIIQADVFSINTYEQDMIAFGKEGGNKNKYRWNYSRHMTMFPLLVANYFLPLFHITKSFIWLNETKNVLMSLVLDIWLIQV